MTLQDHVIKVLFDFYGLEPLKISHHPTKFNDHSRMIKASYHPAKFGGYSYSASRVIMVLVCHVILQCHIIKGSCDFIGGSPSWYVTTLSSLLVIGIEIVEI